MSFDSDHFFVTLCLSFEKLINHFKLKFVREFVDSARFCGFFSICKIQF